jgi:hypothetical protein
MEGIDRKSCPQNCIFRARHASWLCHRVVHWRVSDGVLVCAGGRCSFHLVPHEGSGLKALTQGKLSAPRILRVHKVITGAQCFPQ